MAKKEFFGEFIGTFCLVLFGCGSVAVTTLFNAHQGLLQIALLWGIAVTIAIYCTRTLSCAHFNPAVSVAMALTGRLKARKLPLYLAAQFSGAFSAGLALYIFFSPSIAFFERAHHIVRGSYESIQTARIFGEYYAHQAGSAGVDFALAMGAESFETFMLVLAILFLTERCNAGKPDDKLAPIMIGLSLTSLICLLAPITQAGFNPARDFGPRMVAFIFGWGARSFPDANGGFFWVYMISPVVGGALAGFLFATMMEPLLSNRRKDVMASDVKEAVECNRD